MRKKIKVFEAFAGVGSQRMALKNLSIDHEVIAIAEVDKFAIKSYEAIHGETNNLGDISQIETIDIPDHDLFTYSFPCQDISTAGKGLGLNEGSDTRSGLLWECQKVIHGKRPKYLLLENVKNLIGKKHKHNFDRWLQWLEKKGYTNYWQVLNAKDYGIPQNRERVFVVSILGHHKPYKFPDPIKLETRLKDILENEVDEKFYLSNETLLRTFNWKAYQRPLKKVLGKNSISKTLTARGAGENHSGMVLVDENADDYIDYDKIIAASRGRNPKNPSDRNIGSPTEQRLEINKQGTSNTITTVQKDNYVIEPSNYKEIRIRKLTPKECWRLMGFSDDDFNKAEKVNSNTQLYKQAGNSIVVDVLEGIFKQLLEE